MANNKNIKWVKPKILISSKEYKDKIDAIIGNKDVIKRIKDERLKSIRTFITRGNNVPFSNVSKTLRHINGSEFVPFDMSLLSIKLEDYISDYSKKKTKYNLQNKNITGTIAHLFTKANEMPVIVNGNFGDVIISGIEQLVLASIFGEDVTVYYIQVNW